MRHKYQLMSKKMTIERSLSLATDMTKSGAVHWDIQIEGTRENASAVADIKGNILGLDLSQTARAAQFSTYSADTLREAGPQIKEAFGGRVKLIELLIYEKFLSLKAKSPRNGEITQRWKLIASRDSWPRWLVERHPAAESICVLRHVRSELEDISPNCSCLSLLAVGSFGFNWASFG